MSEPVTSVPVPAAMPGVEDLARLIDPEAFGLPTPYTGDNWLTDRDEARDRAKLILDLFAPILAEKEREIREMADHVAHADAYQKAAMSNLDRALAAEKQAGDLSDGLIAALAIPRVGSPSCGYANPDDKTIIKAAANLEARALAAEAALDATKEVSRQTVVAFFEELALRGIDQDMMADAMEALADRSDIAVAEARAAAIRAQGE